MGGLTVLYYASTTALAVFTGLVIVNLVQPGTGINTDTLSVPEHIMQREPTTFADIILSLVHPNLVAAAASAITGEITYVDCGYNAIGLGS